jgi:uncharacterized NAD(P)/FAD-binding protein YdhS
MTSSQDAPLKIAIIGAGFSGTALAAALHRYADQPVIVYLFEKTGLFGAGDAYRTPFSYHLLNARAGDMSALEDEPQHFVNWLQQHVHDDLETDAPVGRQFVPRIWYHQYLTTMLNEVQQHGKVELQLLPAEVIDVESQGNQVKVVMRDQKNLMVDKVVLALGNNPPSKLPFAVSPDMHCIENPWDYTSLNNIPADEPVMIIGTGLSMVDAVLTLHHQKHRGKITAVSRRGLLPLPHTEQCAAIKFDAATLPTDVRSMMKALRAEAKKITEQGGDWRGMMSALRTQLPALWQRTGEKCRKQFLRHVLPYWNIHRHRVHVKLYDLLMNMREQGQFEVLAGRVLSAHDGQVRVRLRQSRVEREIPVKHIVNCMGSSFEPSEQPLLQSLLQRQMAKLDTLQLGMEVAADYALKAHSGEASANCYVLGPPMRGEVWECIAVPEIRKQCKSLARTLLDCRSP